ncbi:hypothetical protein [Rhodococcus coprophilus]|uniref:Uncharacterized protein n=1 Tax=Rhodococcus coprophilus TaxID=38310 RepID=A0A2X4TMH1_9NOCA|nr:hypothetical protein [Rhodococcus coprophilus]MBM7460791.1 hypothetical protein [Rhodococcus coprophilus]SQI28596.1 Uncharacterised protein [Rhodococcus coprophilus]
MISTETLAAHIRAVDGDHSLSAAELAEAILARYAVVELPERAEPDDNGLAYYPAAELRVDYRGTHGPAVRDDYHTVTPEQLRITAAEYLAAARDTEDR